MDVYICITDENGDCLSAVNIYADGSDSELSDELTQDILLLYDGAKLIDQGDIP